MNKQPSVLLSVREFAEALNVTVSCVRRWVLERRVETVKARQADPRPSL